MDVQELAGVELLLGGGGPPPPISPGRDPSASRPGAGPPPVGGQRRQGPAVPAEDLDVALGAFDVQDLARAKQLTAQVVAAAADLAGAEALVVVTRRSTSTRASVQVAALDVGRR